MTIEEVREAAILDHLQSGMLRGLVEQGVEPDDLYWTYCGEPRHNRNYGQPDDTYVSTLLPCIHENATTLLVQIGDRTFRGRRVWAGRTRDRNLRTSYPTESTRCEYVYCWGEVEQEG